MDRRDFLKTAGAIGATASLSASVLGMTGPIEKHPANSVFVLEALKNKPDDELTDEELDILSEELGCGPVTSQGTIKMIDGLVVNFEELLKKCPWTYWPMDEACCCGTHRMGTVFLRPEDSVLD